MTTRIRCLIVALALLTPLVHGTTAAATLQIPYPVIGRVVDGNGRVQRPSTLIACPIVGTTVDCAHKVAEPTGPLGVAVLKLNKTVRYHLFAFVENPNPAWPCPGVPVPTGVVYVSNESFDGLPSQLPQLAKFTVAKPRPADCVPVKVTDDAGNPLPGAGLSIDGAGGNGPADANGVVRVKVTAGATYEIRAFLANSGWPCPAETSTDGTTQHFSETRTVTADQLLAGTTTFVIHHPTAAECARATVKVTDDAGNPVPNAGLFVDDGFSSAADANGNIQLAVTPGTSYQIGAFVGNTGWPCPQFTSPDGTTFHFAPTRTVTADELLTGTTTFVIVKPRPDDCALVTITDDAGNPLPGAGLFINGAGGSGPANANGIVQVTVTAGATYEIGAFVANSGWPCPAQTLADGTTHHVSETRTVTTEQLLAGQTFIIHKPDPNNCARITITDDAGNPVPNAGLFVDDGFSSQSDANGNIQLAVTPGTSYQIGAFVGNTGWPCPGFTSPDGTTFHFAPTRTVTAEQLLTGTTTFVIVKPRPDDCALVKITDDAGNPLPGAGLFINGAGGTGPANANGTVQVTVTAGATYEIGAFLVNSGWPCPAQTLLDGTTHHVSETRTVTTEQLLAGQTFVIRKPDASECVPRPTGAIRMFDQSGAALRPAFVSYCEYDPATPPSYPLDANTGCPRGSTFRGPDSDGVIRIPVTNPDSNIDITGFLSCTTGGFLFGDFNNRTPNGYTFWRISANDLVTTGLDLKILGDTAACLAPGAPT